MCGRKLNDDFLRATAMDDTHSERCVCACECANSWKAASWVTVWKPWTPCWQVIHSCKGWSACQKGICLNQKVKRLKTKRGKLARWNQFVNLQPMPAIVRHNRLCNRRHPTFLLGALNLEIDILSSIMLIGVLILRLEASKFYFDTAFRDAPALEFFMWKKKSIYGARQCVRLCATSTEEKPRKEWMKNLNERLVEAEVQKRQELQVLLLGERAQKCECFFSTTGAWWLELFLKRLLR